jgi:hypothetical protein
MFSCFHPSSEGWDVCFIGFLAVGKEHNEIWDTLFSLWPVFKAAVRNSTDGRTAGRDVKGDDYVRIGGTVSGFT